MAVQPLGNGVTLCLEDAGTGIPVVFLHGVMMSRDFFKHQIPYFSKHYRVLAPDFRGHGDSDKVLSGHTVSTYAQDLRAVFETRHVERPVLVGWSMGAMVIFEYLTLFGQEDIAQALDCSPAHLVANSLRALSRSLLRGLTNSIAATISSTVPRHWPAEPGSSRHRGNGAGPRPRRRHLRSAGRAPFAGK